MGFTLFIIVVMLTVMTWGIKTETDELDDALKRMDERLEHIQKALEEANDDQR